VIHIYECDNSFLYEIIEDYKEAKTEEEKKIELIMSVLKTKKELELAIRNFETAERGLVDYYIYQIKASKSKLDYLVNKARDKGISLDMIQELYFRKNQVG